MSLFDGSKSLQSDLIVHQEAEEQDLRFPHSSWSEYTLNALTRSHVVLPLVFGKRSPLTPTECRTSLLDFGSSQLYGSA